MNASSLATVTSTPAVMAIWSPIENIRASMERRMMGSDQKNFMLECPMRRLFPQKSWANPLANECQSHRSTPLSWKPD